MQPYLFPYLGYFQLINAVDTFVVYDDVTYIKQGWINRNYILANGKKQLITLALEGASSYKRINQVRVGKNRNKLLKTVRQVYSKAPCFADVFPLLEQCLMNEEDNLAQYVNSSLRRIADYLGIETRFVLSSSLEKNNDLKGQNKVLEICSILGATQYINAIGGQELYSTRTFREHTIDLYFIKTDAITYRQFENDFIPNLSIIDVLMFNPKGKVIRLLNNYELVH